MRTNRHKLPTNELFKPWKGKQCPDCRAIYEREKSARAYLKKNKKVNTPLTNCYVCDKALSGNQRKLCSRKCQLKDARMRKEGLEKGQGKCAQCGNKYTKDKESQRTCPSCKDKKQREKEKNTDITHRTRASYRRLRASAKKHGRYARLLRKRRHRLIKLKLEQKRCLTCDAEMPKKKHKYCSRKCDVTRRERKRLRKRTCRQRKLSSVTWKEIADVYDKCPKGHEVDHIIPLHGKNVSGLHVPWNFQYLSKDDNGDKSNKFDGTYDNEGWKA